MLWVTIINHAGIKWIGGRGNRSIDKQMIRLDGRDNLGQSGVL